MTRLTYAWRAASREQRLAALAAIGLFVSMLLPWYSKTNTVVVGNVARATEQSLSAFQAFSFVEAAVLLVSAGVLAMLFARAERRDFQLPGGDGTIVAIAGGWAALLIFYRLLDKPGLQSSQRITATVGVEWGIFIALLLALAMLYAGTRMRAVQRSEPPAERVGRRSPRRDRHELETIAVPDVGERDRGDERAPQRSAPAPARAATPTRTGVARRPQSGRPRYPPAPAEQLSFEEEPPSTE